jgi:hypothetical protein
MIFKHILALAAFSLVVDAQAALIDRGNGLIYDEDQNLTWLQDTSYALTSNLVGYEFQDEFGRQYNSVDAYGRMNWTQARQWADQLVYGGFDDWRLPTSGRTAGFDQLGSEIGYMYYANLGNKGALQNGSWSNDPYGFLNTGPFIVRPGTNFWFHEHSADEAWAFVGSLGFQGTTNGNYSFFDAWLVRDGDVGKIPEPGTANVLLLGLAMTAIFARRARRKQD